MPVQTQDTKIKSKAKTVTKNVSDNMYTAANEPSRALYQIQQDIRRKVPKLIQAKEDARKRHHETLGRCYDLEYDIEALSTMSRSEDTFQRIEDRLKNVFVIKPMENDKQRFCNIRNLLHL